MQKGLHFLGDLNCRENPLERFERLELFEQFSDKSLERVTGVEPATPAWELHSSLVAQKSTVQSKIFLTVT